MTHQEHSVTDAKPDPLEGRPEHWCHIDLPDGTIRADIYQGETRHRIFNTIDGPQVRTPLKPGTYTLKAETTDGTTERRFAVDKDGSVGEASLEGVEGMVVALAMQNGILQGQIDEMKAALAARAAAPETRFKSEFLASEKLETETDRTADQRLLAEFEDLEGKRPGLSSQEKIRHRVLHENFYDYRGS